METQIGTAVSVLLGQGGVPAALLVGAWLVARALVPFAERFVASWERFLSGLQEDIRLIAGSLESVGSSLRESAIQQATILHRVEGVAGKLDVVALDMARVYEVLREKQGVNGS